MNHRKIPTTVSNYETNQKKVSIDPMLEVIIKKLALFEIIEHKKFAYYRFGYL